MTRTATKVECVDCAALPTQAEAWTEVCAAPAQAALIIEYRPAKPRPIDPRSGPRSPRCTTHMRAKLAAQRARAATARRERVYEMTAEQYEALKAAQGGTCPCGNRVKHVDHDHRLAREHDHPVDQGCPDCWRGLLCHTCNSDILGRGYGVTRLLALVDYLRNPPARALTETGD